MQTKDTSTWFPHADMSILCPFLSKGLLTLPRLHIGFSAGAAEGQGQSAAIVSIYSIVSIRDFWLRDSLRWGSLMPEGNESNVSHIRAHHLQWHRRAAKPTTWRKTALRPLLGLNQHSRRL